MATLIVLSLLAGYLPVLLFIHVVLCRFPGRRSSPRPAQGAALLAAAAATLLATALAGTLLWDEPSFGPGLVYAFLGCGSIGYIYFVMFCNTESGRRYHVLKLLLARGSMSEQSLRARYSKQYIINKRLERLLHWGILDKKDGRLVVRKKMPLWGSLFFHTWARLLRFEWFPETSRRSKQAA
jgi:hypothetical protein